MNALDTKNESSSWYSEGTADGNTEHSFLINFHRHVKISSISLLFQGGFVAEECQLHTTTTVSSTAVPDGTGTMIAERMHWKEIKDAYIEPENVNTVQNFDLEECEERNDLECSAIKLVFNSSTDFYGRVILYKVEVYGDDI